MQKSLGQQIIDANERTADLAHRNEVLRSQRDFARRVAGAGWLSALALGTALVFLLSGCAKTADLTGAFSSTDIVSISGRDLAAFDGRICNG